MQTTPSEVGPPNISVFVPNYSLQGEDLPCHVRWTGGGPASVLISLPPELTVKEVYNVPPNGVEEEGPRTVKFNTFVVPGYLGLLFRTSRLDAPRKDVRVGFRVSTAEGVLLREAAREVALFRPLLKCVALPEEVALHSHEESQGRRLKRVELENVGEGTAIVLVKLRSNSGGSIGPPARADEFENKFKTDMLAGLTRARDNFPGHTRLLDDFIGLMREPLTLDAQTTKRIRSINRRARAAYKKDKALFSRIVQVLAEAYFGNLELVTELYSFLDYLNSIGEGRVVILNALEALRLKKGKSTILVELQVADVAYGTYPSLELPPITVSADADGEIPIHRLFDWKTGKADPEG